MTATNESPAALRGYSIDPETKIVREIEVAPDDSGCLEALYRAIDCNLVQAMTLATHPNGFQSETLWIDEEALIRDRPRHFFLVELEAGGGTWYPITGRGVVLGTGPEGESVSTTLTLDDVLARVRYVSADQLRAIYRYGRGANDFGAITDISATQPASLA